MAPPSSTKLLALFTLTAGVAWFAIVQAPQWTHEPSRTLDRGSFDVPSIVAVDSRAPSAYVTIKSAAWGQLGPSDRLDLIESLGRAAGAEDFRGLLLRDESGVPVAQWLRNRGVQVIEPLEALPVPTDTPGLEEALPPVFEELPAGLDEPSAALEEPPPVLEEPPAGIEELSPDIEDPRSVLEEPPPVPDASPAPPVEDEP